MRKIHVTWHFFEASGPQGHFFEKTKKNPFLDKVNGGISSTGCSAHLDFEKKANFFPVNSNLKALEKNQKVIRSLKGNLLTSFVVSELVPI